MADTSSFEVTEYGASVNGARAVGVDLGDGIRALIQPTAASENERALAVAQRIARTEQTVSALEADKASLLDRLRRALAQVSALESINQAAISGRRRFFGPVLMKPARPGEWSGEVWLLDPDKRERGQALSFASVAEVHAAHPELWVVGTNEHGVLLDAWGKLMPTETRPAAPKPEPVKCAICRYPLEENQRKPFGQFWVCADPCSVEPVLSRMDDPTVDP